MLIISFYKDGFGICEFAGNKESCLALANIFENEKIPFKISNRCKVLTQEEMGVGSFNYWLKVQDKFRD